METIKMDWEAFEEKYKPIQNHITKRDEFNGWLFETYDEDLAYIQGLENSHEKYGADNIWTILVDTGDYKVMITNGYHYVNRMGYIITEIPWDADEDIEVIDEDDREDEEDDEEDD